MAEKFALIRGKDKILKHFDTTTNAIWKLYNANDPKTAIAKFISTDITKAKASLRDMLDNLEVTGLYTLDTYKAVPKGTDADYFVPDTSMTFSLDETKRAISGTPMEDKTATYSPDFAEHIKMIKDNARLNMEVEYLKRKITEHIEETARLENELKIANDLLESEEEEEEEEAIGSNQAEAEIDFKKTLTKLMNEKGGMIIDNLFSLKKTNENPVVNGTKEEMDVIERLKRKDPKIIEHLEKLTHIAEQKPDVFNGLVDTLENMK